MRYTVVVIEEQWGENEEAYTAAQTQLSLWRSLTLAAVVLDSKGDWGREK